MGIIYDYPLSEQVRTFLRLKALFSRTFYFIERDEACDHHVALLAVFEILDITARADVKLDLLQSLDRQRLALVPLRNNPNVSQGSLEKALSDIETVAYDLHASKGKFGEQLRNHEWLMAIKQRAGIPGGMCDFDLPAYHYWLSLECGTRRQQLNDWITSLLPAYRALQVQLRLLLESGKTQEHQATQGLFQQGKVGPEVRLLRVGLEPGYSCVPEISANKYLLNIRFLEAGDAARSRVYANDVPFSLIFCTL
ncbi:MAG: cell division protein ZapD [Betaproteobacteria bacterium]|nr:cell division protein ZapD [Betaproteobacteria bacterium]